ncbi:type II toxin-antitoxin system RelE/ParE family toxin [Xanthomarina sp. F1114]|uniref:type II toxin-antitoxin system RelE/ParE family toxin n=1 Tax=Xanthomarina sp. F1114 TaxID=2996019 RepID=UPI00225DF95A|nr:type II toxin-antitoxin system RelE/ParE family toxin [Xanthomarina sp. F1114]MCX7546989.1 type II toxin-antitoxin system RelE/ParE family toxin [Xanthomarina sp. F1114]
MANLNITTKAIEDLSNIWKDTFYKSSEYQADIYYNLLIHTCQEITQNFSLSKKHTEIAPSIFKLNNFHHIIFFRITEDSNAIILRILHNNMRFKNIEIEI